MRPPRTCNCGTGAHHRVPPERPLVVFASVAAGAALVATRARRMISGHAPPRRRCGGAGVQRAGRCPCVRGAASSRTCAPDVRLVLIDDASPDPGIAAYFAELGAPRASAGDAVAQRAQPGLHRHRQPRHAIVARGCRAAQFRHDRHPAAGSTPLPALRDHRRHNRHDHAVLEQRGDLLVPALLRGQPVAAGTR